MQRHDPLIGIQCQGGSHGDRFLSDATEPFRDLPLTKQDQHLLLDHPRPQDGPIEPDQLFVGKLLAVEMHDAKIVESLALRVED